MTVYRWVQRFTPLLAEAARLCRTPPGHRWCIDETYVKVSGRWRYVYRAVDQVGQVIDMFVSHAGMRRPHVGSSNARSARRRRRRSRSSPTSRRCFPAAVEDLVPRAGIAPSGTATIGSRPITAG